MVRIHNLTTQYETVWYSNYVEMLFDGTILDKIVIVIELLYNYVGVDYWLNDVFCDFVLN